MCAETLLKIDHPTAAEISALENELNRFNIDRTGIDDAKELSIVLRSPDGKLAGGLHGHNWGQCCEIRLMWVAEDWRGKGHGSMLLRAAEAEALKRKCRLILLSTHSFQAPKFYERHGFLKIAEVEDYPIGHSEIFMIKHLAT